MKFSEILATHVQHHFTQANGGLTNTVGFMHYYYPLNIKCPEYHIYFMLEDRDIHNINNT